MTAVEEERHGRKAASKITEKRMVVGKDLQELACPTPASPFELTFEDCSIHYLGLNKHPHVMQKAKEAIDLYGVWNSTAVSGSYSRAHDALKHRFATLFNKDKCFLFPNEVVLNSSVLPTLCLNREILLLVDEESHAGIIQGCAASEGRFIPFKHNSIEDLKSKLNCFSNDYEHIIVIVESAYSVEGDISPLQQIVALKKKHNFSLYVDETHTFGFYGKHGAGLCDELGITEDVDFITTSLSKSKEGMGGVLATSEVLGSRFQYSSDYHSQSAIPLGDVAVVQACLDVIEKEPEFAHLLKENTNYVCEQLIGLGFKVKESESPLIPIYIRDTEILKKIEKELSEQGIFTMAVPYPIVSHSEAHLRISINNSAQLEELDRLIITLLELGKKYGLIDKQTSYKVKELSKLSNTTDNEGNGLLQDINIHLTNKIDDFHQHVIAPRANGRHLVVGKSPEKDDILLNSNDYLCISSHPSVARARINYLSREHKEVLMSAVFLGKASLQSKLQEKFADFLNFDSTLLSQSGWVANVGLLQTIADPGTPVYIDQFAHASLWEGINFAGAKPIVFPHNNTDRFKRMVEKYGSGILLVDSLYSTIGTICPLTDMIEVAKAHNCIVVVDESHSLGVYEEKGKGLLHQLGLTDQVDFLTASLAKAFGGRAGLIACSEKFAGYFPYVARPAIFSSALLENEIVALDTTLEVISDADARREKLFSNATYLRNEIRNMGIHIASESQIISLVTGSEPQTEIVRKLLDNQGIIGAVFCCPATSRNRTLVRLTVNSNLSYNDLEKILSSIQSVTDYIKR